MGLDNDIRTMAVRERMRVRYDRYTNNEAAQERLELAQVALDELPAYQAKIIKQEVRALIRHGPERGTSISVGNRQTVQRTARLLRKSII